ncbi:histone H3-K9 methyltransferase, partial [Trema orientale]
KPSNSAHDFVDHIRSLHEDIRRKIALSNEKYKISADLHRRHQEFNEGDYVMVRVAPERFPKHAVKKLHAHFIGPFPVIRKLCANAYMLDLPPNLSISLIFNIADLSPYHGTFEPPVLLSSVSHPSTKVPPIPTTDVPHDAIMDVLEDEFVTSSNGGFRRFLVRWKDRSSTDDAWIIEEEFRRIDPVLLEHYLENYSPESSSFQPGGNDEASRRPLKIYTRRKYRN